MRRKEKFVTEEVYHIFNKSIAGFGIFNDTRNCRRFIRILDYYNNLDRFPSYSSTTKKPGNDEMPLPNLLIPKDNSVIKFISYCVMPDHYHLILKLLAGDRLIKFIADLENSFSRFFNIKFKRKGPLWQHSFRAVRVRTNERLLHLTRYAHLNPTTKDLVNHPEDWEFSSYKFYIDKKMDILKTYLPEISISEPAVYRNFVGNHKDYQRKLKLIKKLILE